MCFAQRQSSHRDRIDYMQPCRQAIGHRVQQPCASGARTQWVQYGFLSRCSCWKGRISTVPTRLRPRGRSLQHHATRSRTTR
jgi:hypothetical protein